MPKKPADHHQRRRLLAYLDRAARRAEGGEYPTVECISATSTPARASAPLLHPMAAFATLSGFGIDGYRLAINGLAAKSGPRPKLDKPRLDEPGLTPARQHAQSFPESRSWRASLTTNQPQNFPPTTARSFASLRRCSTTQSHEIEIERSGSGSASPAMSASRPRCPPRITPRRLLPRRRSPISPSIRAWCPRRWSARPIGRGARRQAVHRGRQQGLGGQTLLIIEAMKTMNQIPSPRAGTVTQILVEEASRSNSASAGNY